MKHGEAGQQSRLGDWRRRSRAPAVRGAWHGRGSPYGGPWDDRGVSLLPFGLARVSGPSMVPTYRDGDLLLVRYGARTVARLRAGAVVVARDPRRTDLLIVKRAVRREGGDLGGGVNGGVNGEANGGADGRSAGAGWWLLADNEFALGDSRQFGAVAPELVLGRVVGRLWRQRER